MNQPIRTALDRIVEWILIIIFGAMCLNVIWQVASRFLLGDPSSFTEELARFCLIWLTVLGAAYMVGRRGHIAMDYFFQKADAAGRKRLMRLVYLAIIAFAAVVLVYGGGNLVYLTLKLGQNSAALQIPLGYIYAIVPISGLLMIGYTLLNWTQPD